MPELKTSQNLSAPADAVWTLLEDFGYLPRVAFNLDALFRRAWMA